MQRRFDRCMNGRDLARPHVSPNARLLGWAMRCTRAAFTGYGVRIDAETPAPPSRAGSRRSWPPSRGDRPGARGVTQSLAAVYDAFRDQELHLSKEVSTMTTWIYRLPANSPELTMTRPSMN